uniref:hypothetical protein n=1 Tax=uncultured Draconibacterium sp. TaxID=1573823 RepID=UPI003216B65D
MLKKEKNTKSIYILFPALAMMLAWGLRGHIGGGPFGAMIPGAMIALSISILLELPATVTAVLLVFGVAGIGLGGEMTYGQTLSFLRNPDTVWWGTFGTSLKGAVWGLMGGAVLAIGFVFNKTKKTTIIIAFLLVILGAFIGFKLINDPMLLYFSDPVKPRAESWAALLFGAILLLGYLKIRIPASEFKIIFRYAFWGMVGGGLGFGLGGFWMVLGSHLPEVIFKSWWKAMEFTFGFLFGAFLGYATWLSRTDSVIENLKGDLSLKLENYSIEKELIITLLTGLLVFWFIPGIMELFTNAAIVNNMPGGSIRDEIARILVNYTFTVLLFVLVLIRFPKVAWQIGITLTFCHASIDLIRDFYPDVNIWTPLNLRFILVFLMTAVVALFTYFISKKDEVTVKLFMLLIWSCIIISFLRLFIDPAKLNIEGLTFCQIICGKYIVDIFFVVLAIVLSLGVRSGMKLETDSKI